MRVQFSVPSFWALAWTHSIPSFSCRFKIGLNAAMSDSGYVLKTTDVLNVKALLSTSVLSKKPFMLDPKNVRAMSRWTLKMSALITLALYDFKNGQNYNAKTVEQPSVAVKFWHQIVYYDTEAMMESSVSE